MLGQAGRAAAAARRTQMRPPRIFTHCPIRAVPAEGVMRERDRNHIDQGI